MTYRGHQAAVSTILSTVLSPTPNRHVLLHKWPKQIYLMLIVTFLFPEDWPLFGFSWSVSVDGQPCMGYFFDLFLPFGAQGALVLFLCYVSVLLLLWRMEVLL